VKKGTLWVGTSLLLALSMVAAACGNGATTSTTPAKTTTSAPPVATTSAPKPTTTTAVSAKPQYGGTLNRYLVQEPTWDLLQFGKPAPNLLTHDYLWDGDWSRGPAGGYGTKEFPWVESTNIPDLNVGVLAESIKWTVDAASQQVITKIVVRQGVHYALDSNSEASRLANGRAVTTDDVVFCMNDFEGNPDSQNYKLFPDTREVRVVKTGPWEITLTLPFKQHLAASMRVLGLTIVYPPEVYAKYKATFNDTKNDVGTGPYTITDYVAGSSITLKRNPNYFMKNPVGPGKGDQLPYIDNVKYFIIPDLSTREAALRSATLDQLGGFTPEAFKDMHARIPDLVSAPSATWNIYPMYMRTDLKPYDDVRVRRALMMATDFNAINKSLYQGLGQILSWPTWKSGGYENLYLGLDDPEMPASVKELYSYNPTKAKQLLSDAGFPNGFKTSLILSSETQTVDYYSVVKAQWAKAGIDLTLELKDPGTIVPIAAAFSYKELFSVFYAPNSTWPEQANYTNINSWVNASRINDPTVNAEAEKAAAGAVTDFQGSMKITKNLMKYLLDQAYCIPTPRYPQTVMWWPWLKAYSGETSVGYFAGDSWVKYIWVDQNLKKSMGH
jgi:peptide/nickel transport system substrate-binding protein